MRDDGLEAVNPVELQSETREALLLLRLLLLLCNVLALASRPRDIGRPFAAPKRRGTAAAAAGDGAGRRGKIGLHLHAEELGAEEIEGTEDGIHGGACFSRWLMICCCFLNLCGDLLLFLESRERGRKEDVRDDSVKSFGMIREEEELLCIKYREGKGREGMMV